MHTNTPQTHKHPSTPQAYKHTSTQKHTEAHRSTETHTHTHTHTTHTHTTHTHTTQTPHTHAHFQATTSTNFAFRNPLKLLSSPQQPKESAESPFFGHFCLGNSYHGVWCHRQNHPKKGRGNDTRVWLWSRARFSKPKHWVWSRHEFKPIRVLNGSMFSVLAPEISRTAGSHPARPVCGSKAKFPVARRQRR